MPDQIWSREALALSQTRGGPLSSSGDNQAHSQEKQREDHLFRKERREFINWYAAKPFEIVQVDLKYIRDHKALSREQIIPLDRYNIPNY